MNTTSPMPISKPLIPRYLLVIILAALAGLTIYQDSVLKVLTDVIHRSDSSHGVFVPFLTAYFFWTIKDRIKKVDIRYAWTGALVLIISLIPPLTNFGSFQIQFISYILCVCGLVLMLIGKEMLKMAAFPILFLISMTPLPQGLYDGIANISRTIAFGGSLQIISLLGIPYLRVGWDIELPNALLRVAISCSGIRYLISYVVFGIAYAYLFKRTPYGRIATVMATIPISIFASISRLTVIFVMTYWVSPYWSQHTPHIWLSWFVFFTILFSSMSIDQFLHRKRESNGLRS